MHIKSTIRAAAIVALAFSAAPALAQDATQSTGEDDAAAEASLARAHAKSDFVISYDLDEDGDVSIGEFMTVRQEGYARRDADGDGSLSEDEYVNEYIARLDADLAERREGAVRQAHVRFEVLDTDESDVMTAAEFHESGSRMFSRLDTNEDGFVNEEDTADHF